MRLTEDLRHIVTSAALRLKLSWIDGEGGNGVNDTAERVDINKLEAGGNFDGYGFFIFFGASVWECTLHGTYSTQRLRAHLQFELWSLEKVQWAWKWKVKLVLHGENRNGTPENIYRGFVQ